MVKLRLQFVNIWGDVEQEFVPVDGVKSNGGGFTNVIWASPGGGVMNYERASQIAAKQDCRLLIKNLGCGR